MLDYLHDSYLQFPESRRVFSWLTVAETDIRRDPIDRGGFLQKKANLDTLGFHNLFLVTWITLVDRFKLNLLEAVSVVVAILICPNTAEPMAKAAVLMLNGNVGARRWRGFDFGHQLFKRVAANYGTRNFGLRFNTYRAVNVPSVDTFFKHCRLVFWTCIHVWASNPTKPPNVTIHGVYVKIRALFQKIPGVGELIAMHSVQMMSEMGLLPAWLQTFAAFNHSGRVYGRLVTQFGLGKTRSDARKAMCTLKAGFVKKVGPGINEAIIENLACKTLQLDSNPGSQVCDVHHRRAPVVHRRDDGNGLAIAMSKSVVVNLDSGGLMSRWPFGDDILSMSEICQGLGTAATLASVETSIERKMPNEARRRLQASPVPYQIPRWY